MQPCCCQADDGRRRFSDWQYDVEADIKLYDELSRKLLPFISDTVETINDAYDSGERILLEGANATMLDLDVGTYPFVTSSNCSAGGMASGVGLAPTKFEAVVGVVSVLPETCSVVHAAMPAAAFGGSQLAEENECQALCSIACMHVSQWQADRL